MFSWNQLLDNLKVDQITHEKDTGLCVRALWQMDKSLKKYLKVDIMSQLITLKKFCFSEYLKA